MGYLLALALQNFSLSNLFTNLRASLPTPAKIDSIIAQNEHRLGKVRLPQVVLVMLKLVELLPRDESLQPYATLKVIERLVSLNHRNHSTLNEAQLTGFVFNKLYGIKHGEELVEDDAERSVLQRMLRRLLEMGASTSEARAIYQRAVDENLRIDAEVLDILRSARRAKFPEYFSFDGPASIQLNEDGGRTFPCPMGFTYMVSDGASSNYDWWTYRKISTDMAVHREISHRYSHFVVRYSTSD